jgi:hypothetical protein
VPAADHVLEKFAAFAEFHHHIEVVFIAENVDQMDHAWVIELLDDADLELESGFEVRGLEADSGDDFARKIGCEALAGGEADERKRTLTNHMVQPISANHGRPIRLHSSVQAIVGSMTQNILCELVKSGARFEGYAQSSKVANCRR